ncbi:hypothetical protein [Desulfonatronospira sp.]|uniref:hypothetical protein n=1 Tax=Desulfonatronospira sp. TaxID=1962951 RepID=UPI0025C5183A|nr:hypothetical protein [Desulfonatronospira sp.]
MIIRQYGIENKNPLRARNPATLDHNPRQAGDLPSLKKFRPTQYHHKAEHLYEIGRAGTSCISWGRRGRRNTPVY